MRYWRSIRFQLALWYLVVLAIGMAAFGGLTWVFLREVLLENQNSALEKRLHSVELFLASESRGNDLAALREESREYSTSLPEGQGFVVRTDDGQTLFERNPASGPTLSRTRRITVRGHTVEVALTVPLVNFHRVMRSLGWIMTLVFPAVLLIAASGGWWLAKRAMTPVASMTRDARNISAHDLRARLSVPQTADELEDLALAWNELLDRIESGVDAVRRFTADAAHELRTPVTVIRSSAELALRHPRSPESYRQTLESIEQETVQMTELLDQLLLLARGDAGEWRFRFDTVFADQVVREARTVASLWAERKQLHLEWCISEQSVMLCADERALRQLLLILLDNAVKHTGSGGKISVRLERVAENCVLEVADTGEGIPVEDLPHIFERFYRADPSRSAGGGAGLGLAIAHTIVSAHGGSINALSTIGKGTSLRVLLPLEVPSAVGPNCQIVATTDAVKL